MTGSIPKVSQAYSVKLSEGKSVQDLVAAGHYEWHDPDINSQNFAIPSDPARESELLLVHFDIFIGNSGILDMLGKQGLVVVSIEYLLALGAAYPALQYEHPIICLGCRWFNPQLAYEVVPSLDRWRGGRKLCFERYDGDWGPSCRFLTRVQTV